MYNFLNSSKSSTFMFNLEYEYIYFDLRHIMFSVKGMTISGTARHL